MPCPFFFQDLDAGKEYEPYFLAIGIIVSAIADGIPECFS
jgi:hypothetical protein